jgi:hypothetical protein
VLVGGCTRAEMTNPQADDLRIRMG